MKRNEVGQQQTRAFHFNTERKSGHDVRRVMAVKPPSESAYRKETKIVIYEEGKGRMARKNRECVLVRVPPHHISFNMSGQ